MSAYWKTSSRSIRLAFLTENDLLISYGDEFARTSEFNVEQQKIVGDVTLKNEKGSDLWVTHQGNILVRGPQALMMYDPQFRLIRKFGVADAARVDVSSGGKYAWIWTASGFPVPQWKNLVIDADTFDEVSTFQRASTGLQLGNNGFFQVSSGDGNIYVLPIDASGSSLLQKRDSRCPAGQVFALSSRLFLLPACNRKSLQVLNSEGALQYEIPVRYGLAFVQTDRAGVHFACGFLGYSAHHIVRDLDLPANLAGVDNPSDLFDLRVYNETDGNMVLDLKWGLEKGDALSERYDNAAIALSPSGQLLAFIRGSDLQIVHLPK